MGMPNNNQFVTGKETKFVFNETPKIKNSTLNKPFLWQY